MKDIKIFLKKKKKKSNNMFLNVTKISQKMKTISWLSIEKNIIEWEKPPYYNYKKVFQFRKLWFFFRNSMRNFVLCLCLKINLRNVWFSGLANSFLKYKKLFKSGIFFIFWAQKVTSWNIKEIKARMLYFQKYKKI